MSTYLRHLVARTIGAAHVVRPYLAPRFATVLGQAGEGVEFDAASNVTKSGTASRGDEAGASARGFAERAVTTQGRTRESGEAAEPRALIAAELISKRGLVADEREFYAGDASVPQTGSARSAGSRVAPASDDDHARESSTPRSLVEPAIREARFDEDRVRFSEPGSIERSSSGAQPRDFKAPEDTPRARRPENARIAAPEAQPGDDPLEPSVAAFKVPDAFAKGSRTAAFSQGAATGEVARDASALQGEAGLAGQIAGRRAQDTSRRRGDPREFDAREAQVARDETVINVSIGRIDVRGPAAPAPKIAPRDPKGVYAPNAQLDAYLSARDAARR
jgi:hypothetical protein